MGKRFGEENQAAYSKVVTDFSAYLNKQLSHGKKWVAGDSLTIGDFAAAAVVFSYIHNDALAGGAAFSDKGKKIISDFPHTSRWVEDIKGELAGYLANRPAAPL